MRAVALIEPLEDRIAPATVTIAAGGKSASYLDSLGDLITVSTSKGTFTSAMFGFTDTTNTGQLTQLTLSGHSDFTGANILFNITPAAGGTDKVNIGYIDALSLNLGSVTVPGDLGRIDVGGGKTATALSKLTVQSLGNQGSSTQGGLTASTTSNITGTIGTVTVAGNMTGAIVADDFNNKPGTGNINSLSIGGSLDGATGTGSGEIIFTGTLKTAVIGGGIEGGSADFSGSIGGIFGTFSKIGTISVMGSVPDDPNPSPISGVPGTSLLGGSGRLSGGISAVTVGKISIAGDIFGSTGVGSGSVQAGETLTSLTVGGSLIGGNFGADGPTSASADSANSSGTIFAGTQISSVVIGKSVEGGSGFNSGEIFSTGLIKSVAVKGDVAGGSAGVSGTQGLSGIINGNQLGTIIIGGSLIGGNAVAGDANQLGSGGGSILGKTGITSLSIGKNVIGGSGAQSGFISTQAGNLGSLKIGGANTTDGSILGGSGAGSGAMNINGSITKLMILHDVTGGSGSQSGSIQVNGGLSSVSIGGNLTGGSGDDTGSMSIFGVLKSATIQGNIVGSSSGATKITNTGYVQADGIGTMVVDGALQSGTAGAGGLDTSGAIRSTVAIGSITLGSLKGNDTNPAIVSAVGNASLTGNATSDVAIKSIKVLGTSSFADILAGYGTDTSTSLLGAGVNADAQIGTVTINGAVSGTNIIAGVGPGPNGFGTAGSTALTGAGVANLPTIISKISKIVLATGVTATPSGTDSYGIAAQNIVAATIGGAKVTLTSGADNDTFAAGLAHQFPAGTGDTFLYEV